MTIPFYDNIQHRLSSNQCYGSLGLLCETVCSCSLTSTNPSTPRVGITDWHFLLSKYNSGNLSTSPLREGGPGGVPLLPSCNSCTRSRSSLLPGRECSRHMIGEIPDFEDGNLTAEILGEQSTTLRFSLPCLSSATLPFALVSTFLLAASSFQNGTCKQQQ